MNETIDTALICLQSSFMLYTGLVSSNILKKRNRQRLSSYQWGPLALLICIATVISIVMISTQLPVLNLQALALLAVLLLAVHDLFAQPVQKYIQGINFLLLLSVPGALLYPVISKHSLLAITLIIVISIVLILTGFTSFIRKDELAKYTQQIFALIALYWLAEPVVQQAMSNVKPVATVNASLFSNNTYLVIAGMLVLFVLVGFFSPNKPTWHSQKQNKKSRIKILK